MAASASFLAKLESEAHKCFRSFTAAQQNVFRESFRRLDTDGNGEVSKEELLQALSRSNLHRSWLSASVNDLFRALDKDGNGGLVFNEAIPLVFAVFFCKTPLCDVCHKLVLEETHHRCNLCPDPPGYDLCSSCYAPGSRCSQNHNTFRVRKTLQSWRHEGPASAPASYLTCSGCHRQHRMGATPVFARQQHVAQGDSGWLCELCTVWVCAGCGTTQRSSQALGEGAWSKEYYCTPCTGKAAAFHFNPEDITRLAHSSGCSTCAVLAANGELRVHHNLRRASTLPTLLPSSPSTAAPWDDTGRAGSNSFNGNLRYGVWSIADNVLQGIGQQVGQDIAQNVIASVCNIQ